MWNNGVFTVPKTGTYTMNGINLTLTTGDTVKITNLYVTVNNIKYYCQFYFDNMKWQSLNTHWCTEGNKILDE